jgi:hypothetical protein
MLKASALYIAIIVATIVAIFSASLIATAYFYRLESQKKMRWNRLSDNLASGFHLVLSPEFAYTDTVSLVDLYEEEKDSLWIKKEIWGIYEFAAIASFVKQDTLKKTFLTAPENKDPSAIYLSDEDRPLSLSGDTKIFGDAFLPKSGVKQAYVDGKPFKGKTLVNGNIKESGRKLPVLNLSILQDIEKWLDDSLTKETNLEDSISNSFFNPTLIIKINREDPVIRGSIIGNVVVLCDTVLRIESSAVLQDIRVYSRAIIIADAFQGNGQFFARDSIVAGKATKFTYPSCLGVLKKEEVKSQVKIELGERSDFSGILFSYENERSDLQTMVSLGKNSIVTGEVYARGLIKMEKPIAVKGKVSCNRFIIQTPTTLYENYLIDITLDRAKRSKYYLGSALFESTDKRMEVLKWLN